MDKLKKACETKKRTLESVIAEADGELGKQEPSLEMLMSLRPKLLRCKDRFLIASDCLIEQLIKADREDEEIEDVDIVQANLFGRSEGVLQKMEQLLAKPTVDRESIVSGGNEGKSNLHRLPKLELPKFGGEAREWLQFWSAFQSVHDDDSISACVKFQYLQNCMIKGSVSEEIVSSFPNSAANYPLAISTLKERFGREDMLVEVYVRDLIAITLENAHGRNTTPFSTVYVRLSSQLRALGSLGVTTDKCAAILYPMVESALPEDLFVAWERTRHHHKPDEDGKHNSSEALLEKLMEFLKHEHKRYRIYISDVDSKYNCNFEVQDCSTICSAMPSAQPTEWMTELRSKGIDLDVYRSNTEIELLLGADVYAKLLTGKKIELESGPVALETKLGWTKRLQKELLAIQKEPPPGVSIDPDNIGSSLTHIRKFWELEDVPISKAQLGTKNAYTQGLLRVGGRLKYSYLNENQKFPLLQPKSPRQESLIKNLLTENADIPEAIDENQEDSSILETTFVIEDEESNKDIGTPKIEISEVSVIDKSEGKYSKEPVVSVEALDKKELCHDDSAHLNVVEADLNRPKEATSGIINVYTEANESSSKEKVVSFEIVDTSTKDYLQSGEKAKLSRWKPIDSLCLEDVKESEDDDENYSSSAYIEWPEILKKEVLRPEALEKAVNLEDFEKAAESRQLSKEHLEESTEQGSCIKAESKTWEDPIESDLAAAESDNPAVPERELANESENLIQDSPQSDTQRWKLIPLPFKK
ncbi:hypothetical protein LAZ67_3003885 [Cordylochernes scorpioides]|uniref:Uncharacterized protein n=1 Tax=Cordylochernes scorpioides TaxID=51811 RepID=A0ABY6KA85_9ARAC|nr:hypothetical protein LAZ67_3003885 [Cordylochernes scorpioides]